MRIKMNTLSADAKKVLRPGVEYDLPEEEARALLAGRYAQEVEVATAADPTPPAGSRGGKPDEDDGEEEGEGWTPPSDTRSARERAGDEAFEAAIKAGKSREEATDIAMKAAQAAEAESKTGNAK